MTTTRALVNQTGEAQDLNANQREALEYALRKCVNTNAQLVQVALSLMSDLTRMVEAVDANRSVNDLGVVQGTGSAVDRLCGLRQERGEALVMLLASFGVDAPSAVANELLAQAE